MQYTDGIPAEFAASLYHLININSGSAALVSPTPFFNVGSGGSYFSTNLTQPNTAPYPFVVYGISWETFQSELLVAAANQAEIHVANLITVASGCEISFFEKWIVRERLTNLPQGGGSTRISGGLAFDGAAAPTTISNLGVSNGDGQETNRFVLPLGAPLAQGDTIQALVQIQAAALAQINAQIAALSARGIWVGFRFYGAREDAEAMAIIASRCAEIKKRNQMVESIQIQ